MRRPVFALGLVVAILTITVVVAEAVGSSAVVPGGRSRATTAAPVVGVRLVCPDVVSRQVGQIVRTTRVGVGQPASAGEGSASGGSVVVTRLKELGSAKARPVATLTRPGSSVKIAVTGDLGDLVVDGTGPLAPGLAADIFGLRDAGPYRGIDGVACTSPAGEAWALGASTTVGEHSELRLTNADDQPALVDVTLFGAKGRINAAAGRGVGVPARATRTIRLETLAPEERLLLIRVQVRSGRVATSVRVQSQKAATPQGQDWLPLAAAPSKRTVVPGIAGGAGPRRLVVANPGEIDTTASIQLVSSRATFVPRGLSAVTVRAGSVVSIDVTKALGAGAAAAVVTAERPLVAAASISTGPQVNGYAELAWTAGVPRLTDPASALINVTKLNRSSALILSAPQSAATVRLTTLLGLAPGVPISATLTIPAGRTLSVDLNKYAGSVDVGISVVPLGGSGPVYAARLILQRGRRSPLITVLPLRSAPVVRVVHPAFADLRAGLPR
ncbi:MAG: hypothetical protein QOG53_1146 [Frankiales bacterium]|jgi:hypothetical protein|nr:hypothetical protein [Frankiales bacterium]